MARQSSGTPATLALTKAKVAHTVHEYQHDPAQRNFGDESVAELGLDAARTFKTLIADLTGGTSPQVCAVVPVSGQLDLKALAQAAGAKKAVMTPPAVAERLTGYLVGGISPIGQKKALPIWIDSSALDHPTIWVSGGRRGLSVELAAEDLALLIGADFAAIGRG